jgi:SAM-dependent MidA family methyltransferase
VTALAAELREIIATEGPISVERYMTLCLQHPLHGYYTTSEAIGGAGDFITAPEVDQMFGELIGLWCAQVWLTMGKPDPLRLIELGPGRGTLMADVLRATRILPGFRDAVRVELVETSPRLAAEQRRRLDDAAPQIAWHGAIDDLPDGPAIILANEFFDALPVRHYIRGPAGWHERLLGLGPDGALRFGASASPIDINAGPIRPVVGDVLEIGHVALRAMEHLASRVAREGGALLLCDYGYVGGGIGETLQAMRGHAYVGVLEAPGDSDLTAHVDFSALSRAATAAGGAVHGPVAQGRFLELLGIVERAARLKTRADARQAELIESALARFTAPTSSMATVFKAMSVTPRGAPIPPGFEETS